MTPTGQGERMVVRTLAFIVVRRVLGLIGLGACPDAKDVEIAVLRHQLTATLAKLLPPATPPATDPRPAAEGLPIQPWSDANAGVRRIGRTQFGKARRPRRASCALTRDPLTHPVLGTTGRRPDPPAVTSCSAL
jgi:hypothetical protein